MEISPAHKELHLEILSNVGAGSFATVKRAKYKNFIVAAKIFDRITHTVGDEFIKEVQQLKRLNHHNIIKIIDHGKYRDKNTMYHTILLEFADVGSLEYVLHNKNSYNKLNYTFGHAISWLYQIANAVNYLHTYNPKPIIHRDLKPLNLLLLEGGRLLKICDFGATCDIHTRMTLDKGTPLYVAPEVLTNTEYNEKCDVYSYGVILWELFTRKRPYFDKNFNHMQVLISVKEKGLRPQKISNCPKIISLLYDRIIDVANKRPTMSLILQIFETLDKLVNRTPISPIVPTTPTTPRFDSLFSSSESLASKSEKSPFATVIKNQNQHQKFENPPFKLQNNDEIDRNSFVRNNSHRFSFHENLVNNNINNDHNINNQFIITNNDNSNKINSNRSHRRTRSHGYSNIIIDQNIANNVVVDNPRNINCNSNEIVDILNLNEPLKPILNHQESERIYNEHRQLLAEDKNLEIQLASLKKEKEKLLNIQNNQELYLKSIEQKRKLENDCRMLEEQLNE